MTPLILGALLLSGNTLFSSIKESNKFDTLKQEEQDNLNQILEKKRLMYIKSGLKITGSVLSDLNNIKKNKTKKIDLIQKQKENFLFSSILGMPFKVNSYLGEGRFAKNLFKNRNSF